MRKLAFIAALVAVSLAAVSGAAANQPAVHFSEEVAGDVFACGDETITITDGTIEFTVHEGESASGNLNFTVTIVPKDVTGVTSEGTKVSVHGATWFGGTFNSKKEVFQETFTFVIQFVEKGGGTVASVQAVAHTSPNGKRFFFSFGECEA